MVRSPGPPGLKETRRDLEQMWPNAIHKLRERWADPDPARAGGGRSAGTAQEVMQVRVCVPVTAAGLVDPRWGRADRVAIAEVAQGQVARWEEFNVQCGDQAAR